MSGIQRWTLCKGEANLHKGRGFLYSSLPAAGRYPDAVHAWEDPDSRPVELLITAETRQDETRSASREKENTNNSHESLHPQPPEFIAASPASPPVNYRNSNVQATDKPADIIQERPIAQFLRVDCPEKVDLDGHYTLLGVLYNGCPRWTDGQNYIYMTSRGSWAVCVDLESMANNVGWLFSAFAAANATRPQDVASWKYYTGADWSPSRTIVKSSSTPFLCLECAERPEANGTYSLQTGNYRGRPIWCNGSNYLYMSASGSWVFSTGPENVCADLAWLRSDCPQAELLSPEVVTRWRYCQGGLPENCRAHVLQTRRPPPRKLRVRCEEVPAVSGIYVLLEQSHNCRPMWGCGDSRVYMTRSFKWAVGIGDDSIATDQGWLYSLCACAEKRYPDNVEEWHFYSEEQWKPSAACIMSGPPQRLSVESPWMPELQGFYELLNWEHDGHPVWGNCQNCIFMSDRRKAWVVGSGRDALDMDRGWFYSCFIDARRKYPGAAPDWEDSKGCLGMARVSEVSQLAGLISRETSEVLF